MGSFSRRYLTGLHAPRHFEAHSARNLPATNIIEFRKEISHYVRNDGGFNKSI